MSNHKQTLATGDVNYMQITAPITKLLLLPPGITCCMSQFVPFIKLETDSIALNYCSLLKNSTLACIPLLNKNVHAL